MHGEDGKCGSLFSYIDLEDRVPADHPLRLIRDIAAKFSTHMLKLTNEGLFDLVYTGGRSLGGILVAEGLARSWEGRRRSWCG